jgi:hypothetical protein
VPLTGTDVRHPTGGWRSTVPLTSTDARHLGFLEAICQVCAAEQGWEDLARQIPAVAADERNRPE